MFKKYFLIGGAGFIGSHFIDALLAQKEIQQVTAYDNFSSGQAWHYQHQNDARLRVVKADVKDTHNLITAMTGHDVVIHLASNPDIARAVTEPSIDFTEGFLLTHCVLEAMRVTQTKRILYISGSGVYGDRHETECHEEQTALKPISIYGASKLAGEAFVASYCAMFDFSACVFRFGNVVGPRQTHGVGYDFIRRLLKNPKQLTILGDGLQSKSYVHVEDIVRAVLLANQTLTTHYEIYNVATGDYITVKEIADIITKQMHLSKVELQFTGGDRGWKGDVPIVRLNTDKIQALGWRCQKNSAQAIESATKAMLQQMKDVTCKIPC